MSTFGIVAMIAMCGLAGLSCGAQGQRKPPPSVPNGAVEVTFSREGGRAYCWLDREVDLNRCRTYNWRGERLYRPARNNDTDDVFLRYMGTGPVPEAELKIDVAHST
jgi:hypothetical protein